MTFNTVLTLIGKPGCHLCDDARDVVNRVVADYYFVTVEEKNILEDEYLAAQYHDEIPVLLINGSVHNYWRIDEDRLREALSALS